VIDLELPDEAKGTRARGGRSMLKYIMVLPPTGRPLGDARWKFMWQFNL